MILTMQMSTKLLAEKTGLVLAITYLRDILCVGEAIEGRNKDMNQEQAVDLARWVRRGDGKLLHGSLSFRMAVVARDWEAVVEMAPQQANVFHGTPALDAADWQYLREEAAKDGVTLSTPWDR